MDFPAHPQAVDVSRLQDVIALAPSQQDHNQGFRLTDDELEEATSALRDLEACWITASVDADEKTNVSALEGLIRLFQLGLEVQNHDYNDLAEEHQNVKDESQVLQEEMQEFQRAMEEDEETRERLLAQKEDDQRKIEDLEKRLNLVQEDVEKKALDIEDLTARLKDAQQDNEDMRNEAHMMALQRQASDLPGELRLRDALKHKDWEIDCLMRDNKDLERANQDLRDELDEVKTENYEVSSKIVTLDGEAKHLHVRALDLEEEIDKLNGSNADLVAERNSLDALLKDKMHLLEEFELRFHKQFNAWDNEKRELLQEIERHKANLGDSANRDGGFDTSNLRGSRESIESQEATIQMLRRELEEGKEKEILLLEAYEELEKDVGKEVERALQKHAKDLEKLTERNTVLEEAMQKTRDQIDGLEATIEALQAELEDAKERNQLYEEGIYGLPQAVQEIKDLKASLLKSEDRQQELCERVNKVSDRLEDVADENRELRKRASIPEDEGVDISDIKLEKDAIISQLRSLTSQLESEVWSLEEERRKLKTELRFRAKYHGRHALDMGLSPEQLLMAEHYVEKLKHGDGGKNPELKLVQEMNKRVQFLEDRLAACQAFGELPAGMRPMLLQDAPPTGQNLVEEKILNPIDEATQKLTALVEQQGENQDFDGSSVASVLQLLAQASECTLGISEMRTPRRALGAGTTSHLLLTSEQQEDLYGKQQMLRRELAELQVEVAKKDAQLEVFQRHEAVSSKDPQSEQGHKESVSQEQYNDLVAECAGLKEQLITVMEESRQNAGLYEKLVENCRKYQKQMQESADERSILYRDHTKANEQWKDEKLDLQTKVQDLEGKVSAMEAAKHELEQGIDRLAKGANDEVRDNYADVVRKMAIVQMKHAKVVREVEFCRQVESNLQQRCTRLEIFAQEADALYRPRIKFLMYSYDRAQIKMKELEQQLEDTVPAKEFSDLKRRHMVLERSHRELVEDFANEATNSQMVDASTEELTKWIAKYMACADKAAETQEELRQLKLMFSNVGDKATIESQLNREVVDLVIKEQSAVRRADMCDRAKERAEAGLRDAEERMRGMEERIGKLHSELESAHRTEEDLRRVVSESVAKHDYDAQCKHLQAVEKKCLNLEYQSSTSLAQSNDAQNKISMLERTVRQRQGEIIGLRCALREASSRNETSSLLAKLQLEIEHVRAREAVVKDSQIRAEQAREAICLEFENLLRAKTEKEGQLVTLKGELKHVSHERLKTLRKLDDARAGLIQQWKAEMWARTLKQLRNQNAALESALKSAQQRVVHLEEGIHQQQLEQEANCALREVQNAPLPDVYKELLKCSEEVIELKLAKSRLERSEILTKEQVGYIEKVNAELRGVLDRIDQEALQHQSLMETELRECQSSRCKTECLLIELRQEHEALQNELQSSKAHDQQEDFTGNAQRQNTTNAADQEIMLRQIEGVKEARIQAESFRQKCEELEEQLMFKEMQLQAMQRDQQDLLERLEQGSILSPQGDESASHTAQGQTVALAQIQAFAESAMKELRSQLAAKDGQMKILRSQLESDRQTYLKQHDLDRKEIQMLGNRLLEHSRATIQTLRSSLSQPLPRANAPLKEAINEDGESDGDSYEQLKHLLQEREARIAFLVAQVEEITGELSKAKAVHQQEVLLKEQEINDLKHEIEEAKTALQSKDLQRSWREGERKLKLQLSAKDMKLRHLKEAIKALEEKLVEALKKNADEVMYESSWREQEKLTEQMGAVKMEKSGLEKELETCKKQLAKLKETVADKDTEIEKLNKNLDREIQSNSNLGSKLNKERANRRDAAISKDKEGEIVKAGLEIELERKVSQAEKRITVLQEHNKKLRSTVQQLEEAGERTKNPDSNTGSNSNASQLLSKQKVQHWEEAKRLQKKVDTLRAQVNKKNQDLAQATKEIEKWQVKVAQLQSETSKQAALVQSLKEQLHKAKLSSGTRPDNVAKMEEYADTIDRLEQRRNELELENALVKRQLIELRNQTEEGDLKKRGWASEKGKPKEKSEEDIALELLQKEEELFESRLRRDQAEAQAKRLKQTLKDFFGGEDGSGVSAIGKLPKKRITAAREEELLTTINTLRKALERSQQGVPISKHRQVVEKRKELQKKVEELSERCSQLRDPQEDVKQLERRCEELQTSNLMLRRQVTKFQDVSANLEQEEKQRKQKETENAALRKALAKLEARSKEESEQHEAEKSAKHLEEGGDEGDQSSEVLQALKDRVVELELENQDLRKELEGFDPTFFEEIEDLKHEHHQLSQKVVQYEQIIQQMAEEERR